MGTVPHSGTWSLLSKLTEGLFFLIFHEYNPSVSCADMLHEERKAFFKKKPLASLVYDKGAFGTKTFCAYFLFVLCVSAKPLWNPATMAGFS